MGLLPALLLMASPLEAFCTVLQLVPWGATLFLP